MQKIKILLIEDDNNLAQTIKSLFKNEYAISTAYDVTCGMEHIQKGTYDLYIVDILLPNKKGLTGLDIVKYIRNADETTPILIITGKKAINFKLGAFNIGADDYLCKPFNLLELKARIRALIKRTEKYKVQNLLRLNNLCLERETLFVNRAGQKIDLRKKEFELLEFLLQNSGKIISRQNIINSVWNNEISNNTVDVYIKTLRQKIDAPFEKKLIKTIYGIGYRIS